MQKLLKGPDVIRKPGSHCWGSSLLDAVASVLKVTGAEVETRLREIVGNEPDERGS